MQSMEREILRLTVLAKMCSEAPRDEKGNVVVSLVAIGGIGAFYLFEN